MKSHGIILRGWEARAIIEGLKTQMRLIVKPQPPKEALGAEPILPGSDVWQFFNRENRKGKHNGGEVIASVKMPYSVGDRLWGREKWCQKVDDEGFAVYSAEGNLDSACCYYAADGVHILQADGDGGIKYRSNGVEASPWRSSATMPRWASRILLEVTQVRAQRVQEITEEDALKDGGWVYAACPIHKAPLKSFAQLWNSIHGPDAWDRNDWVWAVTFKRLEGGAA